MHIVYTSGAGKIVGSGSNIAPNPDKVEGSQKARRLDRDYLVQVWHRASGPQKTKKPAPQQSITSVILVVYELTFQSALE
jgi:hypothetical protein